MKLEFRHKTEKRSFSADSQAMRYARLVRRVSGWANEAKNVDRPGFRSSLIMVTLTFAPPVTYEPNLIRDFMTKIRDYCGDKLIAYAWVAELQQRGETHYHILLKVAGDMTIPAPDQEGWWPWGNSNVVRAEKHHYIVKYAQKQAFQDDGEWREFPKGARIFAVWLNPKFFSPITIWRFRLTTLSGWLRHVLLTNPLLVGAEFGANPGGGVRIVPKWREGDNRTHVLFSPWVISLDRSPSQ